MELRQKSSDIIEHNDGIEFPSVHNDPVTEFENPFVQNGGFNPFPTIQQAMLLSKTKTIENPATVKGPWYMQPWFVIILFIIGNSMMLHTACTSRKIL